MSTTECQPHIEYRFWSKVDKTSSLNGCWLWTASTAGTFGGGYGQFWYNGRNHFAHRFSWIIKNGLIPEGLQVHHNCPGGDNPLCVNPDHLWLGTQQDNMDDKVSKGRQSCLKGEKHCNAMLTELDILEIRDMYDNQKIVQSSIADIFGVSHTHISRIVRREQWKTV